MKKILCCVLAILMVSSAFTLAVGAVNESDVSAVFSTADEATADEATKDEIDSGNLPENPEGTNRYYFYVPKDEWIESNPYFKGIGIYWWEGSNDCPAWPGYEAKYTGYDSVYYYDVPVEVKEIIWTAFVDGGEDHTEEIYAYDYRTTVINSDCYEIGANDFYPNGKNSFHNSIYVIDPDKTEVNEYTGKSTFFGEWFYYYYEGEYGLNLYMDDGPIYWGDTKNLDKVYKDNFVTPSTTPTETPEEPTEITTVTEPQETTMATEPTEAPTESTPDASDPEETTASTEPVSTESTTVQTEPTEVPVTVPTETTEATVPSTPVASEDETEPSFPSTDDEPSTGDEPATVDEYEFGDVNKDNKLNIKDATLIQKYIAKLSELDEKAVALADFDKNGKVNVKDATAIQKKIAGLI